MERLRDHQAAPQANARTAARLTRAAKVAEPKPGLERRIWARMEAQHGSRGRMRLLLPAIAGLIVIALVGFSFASALHVVIERMRAVSARRATESATLGPAVLPPTPAIVARDPAHLTRAVPDPAAIPRPPGARRSSAQAPAIEDPEAALILDATRALRGDHDATKAIPLLERYLKRYPEGDLVEECSALLIEAKVARGDDDASAQAQRYLQRFPAGRFRELAEHATKPTR